MIWSNTISLLTKNDSEMIWPDQIGFDHKGNLLFVTNKMHQWVQNMLSWTNESINFRIWSLPIGGGSYLDPIPEEPSFFSGLDLTSYIVLSSAAFMAVLAGCLVGYCHRKKPSNPGINSATHTHSGGDGRGSSLDSVLSYKEVNENNEEEIQ